MTQTWEETFRNWGAPPSATEQETAANAERAVRKAIAASDTLADKSIDVFTQGSYANRTNVRQDSDVDICVLYTGAFFSDYSLSEGLTDDSVGATGAAYPYSQFKNEVQQALHEYFGAASVTRGNKAFDVHANSYRIAADVVPCFEHRRYWGTPAIYGYDEGTELHPDNGGIIINWPRQNYENGVSKNDATGRRFKAVTRILKRLRYAMIDEGITVANTVPSYLLECLVWNVPNSSFGNDEFTVDVRDSVAYLWNETRGQESCNEWGEVNDLKYLFRVSQPWTREDANDFLQAAWNRLGFK